MPRFAANLTMMFNEWPFLDRFGAAADAGFDAVEFLFPYDHPPEAIGARLQRHRERGDRVILASSSLDIVIAAIARDLGVDWVASELGFNDEKCTGALVNDLTGRKPAAISALTPPGASLHVYSDNRSDKALLRMADQCTIILPEGSGSRRWAGEGCEYLAL